VTVIPLPLWQFVAMALGLIALLFGALLLGWRLGRESVQRPMFQFTAGSPMPKAQDAMLLPMDDPYEAAKLGVGGNP
jgi:hypothetical protein